jgi:hypothetical protein
MVTPGFRLAAGGLLLTLAACRPQRAAIAADGCAPPRGTMSATATAEGLTGAFRLTLVAQSGPRSGQRVEGSLSLVRSDTVHYGAAELDLAAVGAYEVGSLTATDPTAPGVRLFSSPGNILLRLGADANRAGEIRFEGSYTVLRVRDLGEETFGGVWVSGAVEEVASGYFCARRA